MTLKEELEILRGEPIKTFDGDPMDIPCIETSDAEKLCKHPVVSVQMITYNHEPYIRQAIEGVMMQKTDFEFELIIGEDASQDKTREICFEYQKRYPDKIRVLWWHENVSKLGGNSRRCSTRCRGEFIALCEGDDYWIDPLKLQKQVDLIRAKKAVMCVAFNRTTLMDGQIEEWTYEAKEYITREDLYKHYFHTSTYVVDKAALFLAYRRYFKIVRWYDVSVVFCLKSIGKVCLLPEIVSVYRRNPTGITYLPREKFRKFVAKQYFDLLLHGPHEFRHYFFYGVQKMVDFDFNTDRRHHPLDYLKANWLDLIKVHILLWQYQDRFRFGYECTYAFNVLGFFVRMTMEKLHMGFLLK